MPPKKPPSNILVRYSGCCRRGAAARGRGPGVVAGGNPQAACNRLSSASHTFRQIGLWRAWAPRVLTRVCVQMGPLLPAGMAAH